MAGANLSFSFVCVGIHETVKGEDSGKRYPASGFGIPCTKEYVR